MKFKFNTLEKKGDIEYINGPILSLFVDTSNTLFLCSWIKQLENSHLWLVFETTVQDVLSYLKKELDFFSLSKKSEVYYVVEIGNRAVVLDEKPLSKKSFLDSNYLHIGKNIFFDEYFCEDEQKIWSFLTQYIQKQKILFELISVSQNKRTFTKTTNSFKESKPILYAASNY